MVHVIRSASYVLPFAYWFKSNVLRPFDLSSPATSSRGGFLVVFTTLCLLCLLLFAVISQLRYSLCCRIEDATCMHDSFQKWSNLDAKRSHILCLAFYSQCFTFYVFRATLISYVYVVHVASRVLPKNTFQVLRLMTCRPQRTIYVRRLLHGSEHIFFECHVPPFQFYIILYVTSYVFCRTVLCF